MSFSAIALSAFDTKAVEMDAFRPSHQQFLMESFVAHVSETGAIRDADGRILEYTQWPGVYCADYAVRRIEWNPSVLYGGVLTFAWIPESVEAFQCTECDMSGRIEWERLPDKLTRFVLRANKYREGIYFARLPGSMEELDLSKNMFCGSIVCAEMPANLRHVNLSENGLMGSLHLSSLPARLRDFDVSQNVFSGALDCESLPESLVHLDLSSNAFSGSISLDNLPESLNSLSVRSNRLSGTLHLRIHLNALNHFEWQENEFSGVQYNPLIIPRQNGLRLACCAGHMFDPGCAQCAEAQRAYLEEGQGPGGAHALWQWLCTFVFLCVEVIVPIAINIQRNLFMFMLIYYFLF